MLSWKLALFKDWDRNSFSRFNGFTVRSSGFVSLGQTLKWMNKYVDLKYMLSDSNV